MSLLDDARKVKVQPRTTSQTLNSEAVDLAVAWASGEVRLSQVQTALGMDKHATTAGYVWLASALRYGVQNGLLARIKKGESHGRV